MNYLNLIFIEIIKLPSPIFDILGTIDFLEELRKEGGQIRAKDWHVEELLLRLRKHASSGLLLAQPAPKNQNPTLLRAACHLAAHCAAVMAALLFLRILLQLWVEDTAW